MSRHEEKGVPEMSPGTDVAGYVVEAQLGEGGFGTVFLARRGGELYALKLLPLEEIGVWAVRELLNLAKVRHPHVVRLLGHGQWPDKAPRYFVIVMEYVPGRRLDVWASTENPSAREVVRRVLGVARALVALHGAKVVHRDVKEANILVHESTGEAVLVDLGVGGDEEAGWRTGGLLPPGTPDYRSPEAWRFERENKGVPGAHYRSTPADDLYALGVVLYWLLTNRRPFYTQKQKEVDAVLSEAPKPPHLLNPRVPLELSELCLRLLAKKPEERPADAQELCEALSAVLERQEAVWAAPLCEVFSVHTLTTRLGPGGNEVAHYLKASREAEARPRRGVRPLVMVEDEAPAAVAGAAPPRPLPDPSRAAGSSKPVVAALARVDPPEASAVLSFEVAPPAPVVLVSVAEQVPPSPASARERQPASRAVRVPLRVVVGLLLTVVLGGGGVWVWRASPHTASPPPLVTETQGDPRAWPFEHAREVTWEVGRKVAPPWKPPEATGPDFLVTEEAALVEPSTWSEKGEASMKRTQQKKQKGLGPVGKAIATGACMAAACTTGPQVRPEPPSEPCPPGALKTMAELGINIGDEGDAVLTPGPVGRLMSVREGVIRMQFAGRPFRPLGPQAFLKGRLIFGTERVYGRFTLAQERDGTRTWPVCFELADDFHKRGLPMESGSTADTASVGNTGRVVAVDRFQGG
ncbi:serine/threonine protein kinase [Hyalangium versicolor]|uniref:serine/threonine protein kinase n=1 Tax=Hyalangium versicolor TaxID=2861190 RepID=UPI001CCA5888|nr:serine/threonine-protein kinase [Hyalangium versicolor]